jgi:hypothetical protein
MSEYALPIELRQDALVRIHTGEVQHTNQIVSDNNGIGGYAGSPNRPRVPLLHHSGNFVNVIR